ncbi:aldehyde dehydrogenase [Exidia glandulosa HHB12029]|uniref:Aldehyde dehydrogenase n=1 Tax=Exidia glandulosa HHB12029 TaxID=1314781 RepID=A0A166A6T0_EXIGL|nr:aldehyde dehydrogenase [Exidia glandulosa HHB12029]
MPETPAWYTPFDEISRVHDTLVSTFDSGRTLPLAFRRQQLLQLARLFQQNIQEIRDALSADLGRNPVEVAIGDTAPVIASAIRAADSLEAWAAPEKPTVEAWRAGWDTTVYPVPKGAVLIISPWNYPVPLTFLPFIGAVAAGCTVAIKLPEHSPAVSQLFASLIPRYLDPEAFAVINGGVEHATRVLDLKWAHILFTGSGRVGRLVAAAAAKHLTPTTLELGGKSPVFIDAGNTDLKIAAKRILWGKQLNCGQTCVAPDYVLIRREYQEDFITALKEAYLEMWPGKDGALSEDTNLGFLPTTTHFARVLDLLDRTHGRVVVGGQHLKSERRVEPTVLADVALDDGLMDEELFCPLLPIVPVENGLEDAIKIIRERPIPLALYVFTDSEDTKTQFLTRTQSGSFVLNDTFTQLVVHEIPFGGQGDSGYGAYQGKRSFDTFTHFRGFINVPPAAEPFMGGRYPPYSETERDDAFKEEMIPIPEM